MNAWMCSKISGAPTKIKRRTGYERSHSRHPGRELELRVWKRGSSPRLEPDGATGPMLRALWPQWRWQDDHHEVSAKSAASAERAGAGVRAGSGEGRSRGEAQPGLRAGPSGLLSLDDGSRDA